MSRQKTRDTEPELLLRSELHRRGLRYRVHARPVAGLRRVADLVFPTSKVAVFVDGCFWHGCPEHGSFPRRNDSFWRDKILGNQVRDAETDAALSAAGWLPVRVWEHESPVEAAVVIEELVTSRRAARARRSRRGEQR